MDRMEAEDFSLFGLLGRSWELGSPVVDLAFDGSDGAVALALEDGSVAIAKTKDQEPASGRIRISAEDGRSSILPRTKPLPPITRLTVQDGTPIALTAYGKHGFVVGDASGALTSLTIGGERTPFSKPLGAPITAIDHAPETGAIACATTDNRVHLIRGPKADPETLDHDSPIATLAFSPDGHHLAVACENSITHWKISETCEKHGTLQPCQSPASLAWSPDQTRLACGQETGGVTIWHLDGSAPLALPDYPAPVQAVAWSPDGENLVTSGAFRIIAWPLNPLKQNGQSPQSLDTGKPGLAAVEAIAIHPARPLIAAGYENGMLIIAQIGNPDELVLKAEGQGAITSLEWSGDASFIAIGSGQGLAALVELPSQLFR
ncbi:MAG: WD40 repeat domain-containing protein [Geminicoccaceae bacterium]